MVSIYNSADVESLLGCYVLWRGSPGSRFIDMSDEQEILSIKKSSSLIYCKALISDSHMQRLTTLFDNVRSVDSRKDVLLRQRPYVNRMNLLQPVWVGLMSERKVDDLLLKSIDNEVLQAISARKLKRPEQVNDLSLTMLRVEGRAIERWRTTQQ